MAHSLRPQAIQEFFMLRWPRAVVIGLPVVLGLFTSVSPGAISQTLAQGAPNAAQANRALVQELTRQLTAGVEAMDGVADDDFVNLAVTQIMATIELAEIVIKHGSNSDVRERAKAIIAQSQKDVTWLRSWMASSR
jgi:uncharacterized protein (DUF305 family)